MSIDIFTINAFSQGPFTGNPAAYCPLEKWISEKDLQNIAQQNNLSETVFTIPSLDNNCDFDIRWFTPTTEVNLCGHATLAAAFALFNLMNYQREKITFNSHSGLISVLKKSHSELQLDFPSDSLKKIPLSPNVISALGKEPISIYKGREDLLCIFENQRTIEKLKPNFHHIKNLGGRGVIVSAVGKNCDFVSRCFFPSAGIDEDPATGSAHTTLTPYWSKQLNKVNLVAKQLSKRGGVFNCTYSNERTFISGNCDLYAKGEIYL